ncbi:MAG: TetR/AcrR family transcriptional regulator [Planctomycetota bacterium]|nr:TetR/AcrR family transcriptional regulator [Planctomycetota bacterium]
MTTQKPNKPDVILDAAASLFASKPFHEVRLEDIAATAHVGKGTLYLYWASKEEVYLAVIRRGFAAVNGRLDADLRACADDCWAQLEAIVGAIVEFAFAYPGVYRIMRSGAMTPEDPELQQTRRALTDRIEACLREGVRTGQVHDEHPALTTQYLLSFVRGVMLYPPAELTREMLVGHMMGLLRRGLRAEVTA